jgi:hypothetical protein
LTAARGSPNFHWHWPRKKQVSQVKVSYSSQVKLLVSECQTRGVYAKMASAGNKNDNAAAFWCFVNFIALLRPTADRTDSVIPWVVSRGHSYRFLWADSIVQKFKERQSKFGLFAS